MDHDSSRQSGAFSLGPTSSGYLVAFVEARERKRDAAGIVVGPPVQLCLDAAEMELTCSTFEEGHGPGRFHINVVLIPLVHVHDTPLSEAGVHIVSVL